MDIPKDHDRRSGARHKKDGNVRPSKQPAELRDRLYDPTMPLYQKFGGQDQKGLQPKKLMMKSASSSTFQPVPAMGNILTSSVSQTRLPPVLANKELRTIAERSKLATTNNILHEFKQSKATTQVTCWEEPKPKQRKLVNDTKATTLSLSASQCRLRNSSFTASLSLDGRYLDEFENGNFLYLQRKTQTDQAVYDLEVVEHYQVNRDNYYTMSKDGVTHFTKEGSEFCSLGKWEVEYTRFTKMRKIPFFLKYRIWKNFNVWKQHLHHTKMQKSKMSLNANLFLLNKSLQPTLISIRELTLKVSNAKLIKFQPSKIYTLQEFENEQFQSKEQFRVQLETFSAAVLDKCLLASDNVIDLFLEKNKINAEHKMTFMERSALRRECRTLTNFIRLIDFLVIDALIQLAIGSFSDFLMKLNSANTLTNMVTASITTSTNVSTSASNSGSTTNGGGGGGSKAPQWTSASGNTSSASTGSTGGSTNAGAKDDKAVFKITPLFNVVVEMENSTQSILSSPSQEEWHEVFERVLKSCLSIIDVPPRLLSHKMLHSYTSSSAEDDGKTSWSIEQLNIAQLLNDDATFTALSSDIFASLEDAFEHIDEYLDVFTPYYTIHLKNEADLLTLESVFEDAVIDTFTEAITIYEAESESFTQIPETSVVHVFRIDSDKFKKTLAPNPRQCIAGIQALIPQLMKKKSKHLLNELNEISPVAFSIPTTPDKFVNKVLHMEKVNNNMMELRQQYRKVYDMAILMDNYEWRVPDDLKEDLVLMKEGVLSLENTAQKFENELDNETVKFATVINDQVPKLNANVNNLRLKLDHPKIASMNTPIGEVLQYLDEQEVTAMQFLNESKTLISYQVQLKQPVIEFLELNECMEDLTLKTKLWKGVREWGQITAQYNDAPFSTIVVEDINKQVQTYLKLAYQATKTLVDNEAASFLVKEVEKFKLLLPVVVDLRGKFLQDRHWNQIHSVLGFEIKGDTNLTLGQLIEKNVMIHNEAISAISVSAQQEAVLEEMLHKVIHVWSTTEFEVKNYKDSKDVFVLGAVDEVIGKLDDSIVTINTIMGSRFIGAIREEVELWRKKLVNLQETLDEWLMVQKNWMYIENIFSAPDIQRQLPDASKLFAHIDTSWKSIMKRTNDLPLAITASSYPGMKETLIQHKIHLDKIQKSLEDYLETKRMSFPRFYFLSNDELLEILAQSKNPQAVQPHLRKCFENLVKIDFGDVPNSVDMLAMISSENERVLLGKNLKARGNVEDWLKNLEVSMKQSIYKCMKFGLMEYDGEVRSEWVCEHPGQVVATVAQMTWARQTEIALSHPTNPLEETQKWYQSIIYELNALIIKIRGDLTSLERKVIVALVTTDVHARDIVECLVTEKVCSVNNFIWQQQLRYYWDLELDDVLIKHSDSVIKYGYEYMGATSRLVITPLTDRCWMTLTGAYGLKLGAAPAGPAGTGKTESSKDLAKAMAIQCVVFNCSDQIDYKMMGKLFRGLAQAGNWTCLDEFNRIDIEVLSVVAQQLLTLREGRIMEKATINFMGIEIVLLDHHVIVTMNPGYAGRTELPDNLKVCFRPVSMMVPDYALIAEIMLFAEGFGDAKTLSRKMCKLYILCSEQLSQQPHYDYGLRAVKSVLVMAGSLKRSNPTINEDVTLIRALKDSNIPKFLSDDLPLFQAIVYDLFPGIEIPSNDYGEFQTVLELEMQKLQLVPKKTFITKVIQMFDTFNVRFGGTLVGPSGAGKTTCYLLLQNTMCTLRSEYKSTNPQFQNVVLRVLNPKCISMGELYGEFNDMTQEWHDGLASMIMREFVSDETSVSKWTVFDGPIDALWIENMNTVLDDNMTLCLANGERIKLKTEMRMLFEVMDLVAASPATVSRIGVVYMTSTDVGYESFLQSWLKRDLTKLSIPQAVKTRLEAFITVFIDPSLQFIRINGIEPAPSVDMNLVTSFCRLFEALVTQNKVSFTEINDTFLEFIDKICIFALIWSIGGTILMEQMEQFDTFIRSLYEVANLKNHIPSNSLIYDYYLDMKDYYFKSWNDIVPAFQYNPQCPYFEMIVATPDTIRYTYILQALMVRNRPCYITGITGTGKTVIVADLLRKLTDNSENVDIPALFISMNLNFSAQTSSLVTQNTIESKLEKKKKNLLGPMSGKKMIIFIDDVNLPAVEEYGAQPPIELIRQFLDFGGFYDRDKLFWKDIVDTQFIVAAAPAGGGRSHCTPRFVRHFHILCMQPARESSLKLIFLSILGGFLERFPPAVKGLKLGVINCIIDLYTKICMELLPTPSKFHYTFNLRDVSKVFQGILMVTPTKCPEPLLLHKLWIHETCRVFYDRFNAVQDQSWFQETICGLLSKEFHVNYTPVELFQHPCPLLFGDIFKPGATNPLYEICDDLGKVTALLEHSLEDYNMQHSNAMQLVFFKDAISHLLRLTRVLRQPRGNVMCIGVGGSGKQSLTRLAAFLQDCLVNTIEITRGYGCTEFHEDLKKFMIQTGVNGAATVFLFTDSQIVHESFVEDLNNVLNSGEVPNLFANDEWEKIIGDMRPVLKELGIIETRENCVNTFITRVRHYLHIVLCMSPVGSALRVRCRAFPSLINCCTIDWYMNWPPEALESVAARFLQHINVPTEQMKLALIKMCSIVHTTSADFGVQFLQQLQRYVYTTPKSYLDLIQLYLKMLNEKQQFLLNMKKNMEIGVLKLQETNGIVDSLKKELIQFQPILQQKAIQAEQLLKQVEIDQAAAAQVKLKVAKDEEVVAKQAQEVTILQNDAQKDLDVAMPALSNAVKALDSLSKNDITEVKSFAKPPEAVETVMNAVCLLLGEKQSWDNAKKVLSDSNFLERLKLYDKDNIPTALLKKLSKSVSDPGMSVEVVSKVSKAATSLCMWVHAMDVYSKVAKEVGPKRENLESMNKKLEEANVTLRSKQEELRIVNENVMQLEKQCKETLDEKDKLVKEANTTEKRLLRAEKLISGLSVEGERWRESVITLSESILEMIGDAFLAAACISYYGAFTGSFRQRMIDLWLENIHDLAIPASKHYSLSSTLGTAVGIREWQLNGLPTDSNSTDNAILVTRGERWPLMIDPQGQANKWIKNTEKGRLDMTKMTNTNLLRLLETCIRNGKSLLIEDIEESLEPSLEPILQKAIFKQSGRVLIHLGDSDIDYDPQFKLYMTTKLSNPHYLPEVYIKVTIINFTVTMSGLEDQLLGDVVKHELPEMEIKKNRLVLSMASDKKQLKDIEERILKQLSESSGNILDDEDLINTLASSKTTSRAIKERVMEAEITESEINKAREEYRSVATRGSILYFVVASLANIDPMYQYSLPYFQRLFNICFDECEKSMILKERLQNLIVYQTHYIYKNICRGLFEVHKVLFSVLICCKIMLYDGRISSSEWSLFLRGAMVSSEELKLHPNPIPESITENQWAILLQAQTLTRADSEGNLTYPLQGICESITLNATNWISWYKLENYLNVPCPDNYDTMLSTFQKVILMKGLAEEKVQMAILNMISIEMDSTFGKTTTVSMEDIYNDTDYKTPCIFVLSAGADPTGVLLRFAKERQFHERLHLISLGQGQGPRAEQLMDMAQPLGDWVLLQNCHLAKSWMNQLDKKVEELQLIVSKLAAKEDSGGGGQKNTTLYLTFRLFLTSFPAAYFPVTVLQNGIKLTNEPPKGIRANLIRSFTTLLSPEAFEALANDGTFENQLNKNFVWQKLLCSLVFFHAIIQERRKFGPLGWNIKYEFNDTDLETSFACLKKFLQQQNAIPWDALQYVTGQINYGGRVTDDWDRRCLMSILNKFYTPQVLEKGYMFSSSGLYYAPDVLQYTKVLQYYEQLPLNANPEVFGMHENANVTFERNESLSMSRIVLSLEPRDGGNNSGGKSNDQRILELAFMIQETLPSNLSLDDAGPSTFQTRNVLGTVVMDSLATVLLQEIVKFNKLLTRMRISLVDIQKAINGLIVMSFDLDNMYTSFLNNKVPAIWEQVSFASLKSLAPWVADLVGRVQFFQTWLKEGQPVVFNLPAFFFPQGFMTGTLQNYARKYQTAIDCLGFQFHVMTEVASEITESPSDGIYIDGLWLEGARWNVFDRILQDAKAGEMFAPMSLIHFLPAPNIERDKLNYPCPVYKTSVRKGTLSTTGLSTNFVVAVYLPTNETPDYWVMNGAAFLLNLDE